MRTRCFVAKDASPRIFAVSFVRLPYSPLLLNFFYIFALDSFCLEYSSHYTTPVLLQLSAAMAGDTPPASRPEDAGTMGPSSLSTTELPQFYVPHFRRQGPDGEQAVISLDFLPEFNTDTDDDNGNDNGHNFDAKYSRPPTPSFLQRLKKRWQQCRERWSFMLMSVSAFAALTGLLMGYDMCVVAVVLDPVDQDFELCGPRLSCPSKTLFVSILAPGAVVSFIK